MKRWLRNQLGIALLTVAAALPVSAAENSGAKFQGVPVVPGATVSALVPLSPNEKKYAAIDGNRSPEHAVAVLGVPPGFDPRKSWPVLIVFSTSDFRRENRGDIPFYLSAALDEGWLVLTGDGPELPRTDTTGWRAAMTLAALDALHRSFPSSGQWPIACAGISGGAKRACLIAPLLAAEGDRVVGLYLAGINEDMLSEGFQKFRPGKHFLNTKIFITSGQRDKIATPAQTGRVQLSFQKDGFRRVRLEKFPEAHNVKRPLTHAALRWFRETATPAPSATTSGNGVRLTAEEIGNESTQSAPNSSGPSAARRKQIIVTVKASSPHAPPVNASVFFVGRAPGDAPRFIYAHADLSINLHGAAQAQTRIDVPAMETRDPKKDPPRGFVFAGVRKAEGWIVVAQSQAKVLPPLASSADLLGLADATREAMIADYRERLQKSGTR